MVDAEVEGMAAQTRRGLLDSDEYFPCAWSIKSGGAGAESA